MYGSTGCGPPPAGNSQSLVVWLTATNFPSRDQSTGSDCSVNSARTSSFELPSAALRYKIARTGVGRVSYTRKRLSGDQTGAPSTLSWKVTLVGCPPAVSRTQMSRFPPDLRIRAIHFSSGERLKE